MITSGGVVASESFLNSWSVASEEVIESVEAEPIEEEPAAQQAIGEGFFITAQSGTFYAQSAVSLFVANQVDFTIDHVNPATDTVSTSVLCSPFVTRRI